MQNLLLDLIFPKCCVGCGRVGSYICRRCVQRKLRPYYVQQCHVCRHEARKYMVHTDCRQNTHLDGVVVGYVYNNLIEKLMMMVKYQFYYAVIDDVAKLVAASIGTAPELNGGVLSYVPANPYRQRWRGFNQAQILASQVARLTKYECRDVLERVEFTHSQIGQGREERLQNLRSVFRARAGVLQDKVIVVDDVMTTGSTLEQCARVLKQAGVKKVYGLVFARGWYLPAD